MHNLDEYMDSPRGMEFRREMAEHNAHMRATSFTYRHSSAFMAVAFGMILGTFCGLGYFMVNGNAADHLNVLSFVLGLGFAGIGLLVFTFCRTGGSSLFQSIGMVMLYFGICGGLGALVGMLRGF